VLVFLGLSCSAYKHIADAGVKLAAAVKLTSDKDLQLRLAENIFEAIRTALPEEEGQQSPAHHEPVVTDAYGFPHFDVAPGVPRIDMSARNRQFVLREKDGGNNEWICEYPSGKIKQI
jgi:hypothetical protein